MIQHFLLTNTVCLLAFFLFYKVFLENLSIHNFKRFYLIATLIISFIIPFVKYEIIKEVKTVVYLPENLSNTNPTPSIVKVSESNFTLSTILWSIYLLIAFVLVFRVLYHIFRLQKIVKTNEKIKQHPYNIVLLNQNVIPHSWFHNIMVNKNEYRENKISQEIFEHEIIHSRLFHSVDIVFIEICKALFWYNPLLYLYKKAIKLNHEFQADSLVLQSHNISKYQQILLALSNKNQNFMVNTSNYLVTKKRFVMMALKTKKSTANWAKASVLPILFTLIYTFCINVVAQEKVIIKTVKATPKKELTKDNSEVTKESETIKIQIKEKEIISKTTDTVKKKNIANMQQKDGLYFDETGSYDANGNPLSYGYIIKDGEIQLYTEQKKGEIITIKKKDNVAEQMVENTVGFEGKKYRFVNNSLVDDNNAKVNLKSLAKSESGYLYMVMDSNQPYKTGTYFYVISDDRKNCEIYNRWGIYQDELTKIFNN